MEYGFGYIITRSPYTPYSIYLRGTIVLSSNIGASVTVSSTKDLGIGVHKKAMTINYLGTY